MFAIFRADARSILSPTSGFIAHAGFTHSLTPARNCTFGCTYCYVPTMRVYAGLKREDWERWGQFTTFKSNAPELLSRALRADQIVYCSPLVDPYQPAEAAEGAMPRILDAVLARPPRVFVLQTRGPLILRDLDRLRELQHATRLRVSFSISTNRDDIRRWYEPHCAPVAERFKTVNALRNAGIEVYATLAPLLPCDPEELVERAVEATARDVLGDPFHVRATKRTGATTREQGFRVSAHRGFAEWHDPVFQRVVVARMQNRAAELGRRFTIGEEGFAWLSKVE